jgi:hypothetical protein
MPDYYVKDDEGNYSLSGSSGSSGPYGPQSTIGFEAPWVEQYRRGFPTKIKWCKNLLMMCTKIFRNKTCRQGLVR